jgi:hypothetical protein
MFSMLVMRTVWRREPASVRLQSLIAHLSSFFYKQNETLLDLKLSLCSECFILYLGDSLSPEFYAPTFRNTLFHFHRSCEQEEQI